MTPTPSATTTAGAVNCQADIPAARDTTSSSRRDRPRKQDIAPISTQNGRIRSPICGTRNSEIFATSNADTFGIVADAPHLLDVVEQDDQCEDAQQHGNQRGEEAHAEVALQGADHCAGSATGPVRRTNHSADGVDGPGQDRRRFDDQAARDGEEACRHRCRRPRRTEPATAIGYLTVKTVQAKPIRRSPATARMTARQRPGGALARGARRAEERKGDQDEGKRIERREQAVVEFGAELSRLLPCTADRSGRARSVARGSARAPNI